MNRYNSSNIEVLSESSTVNPSREPSAATALAKLAETPIEPAEGETARAELVSRRDQDPVEVFIAGFGSAKSRKTMREGVSRILACANLPPNFSQWNELTFAHTSAIRARLVKQHSPATVKVTLAALRGVLRTAWKLGQVSTDQLMRAIDLPKRLGERIAAGRSLNPEELQRLNEWCDAQEGAYGVFLCAIFGLLFGAGLRADETCQLAKNAYDPSTQTLRFLRKGDKERSIPLGSAEATAVEAWLRCRRLLPGPWLFVRIYADGRAARGAMNVKGLEYLCKTVAKKAGVAPFTPHDGRRTFATTLLREGVDLAVVQKLMSHASPATTARYDKRAETELAAARRAVSIWRT